MRAGNVVDFLKAQSRRAPTTAKSEAAGDAARREVLAALRLHRREIGAPDVDEDPSLERLLGQLTALEPDALPNEVATRLQLVDQVLAPPPHCEDEVQALMQALRIPLAELLLEGDAFLEDAAHPARQVVNRVYRLIGAGTPASRHVRALLDEVSRTLGGKAVGPDDWQRLLARLDEGLQRQQRVLEHTAERISRKYEGQERLLRARVVVGQRLDALFGRSKIPLILDTLLQVGLQHKLVLQVLREGEDGPVLARDLRRVKALGQFLTGIALDTLPPEVDIPRATRRILGSLGEELRDSPQPLEVRAATEELTAELADPALIEFVPYVSRLPATESGLARSRVEDESLDRWLDRVMALRPGAWLEYRATPDDIQRLRLVWSDQDAVHFVFLTEQGLQERQMTLECVAREMRDGRLEPTPQVPSEWVDRCLFKLVNDLYGKMAAQALRDPLTGCLYRHEFEKHLALALARCRTQAATTALIWLDIDQFHVVNNSYGTATGDLMLREVGRLFGAWLSGGDDRLLARMGGNEFAFLFDTADHAAALDLTQRMVRDFASHDFVLAEVHLTATLSAGILLLDAQSPETGDVINRVALACKMAKDKGGNQVYVYRESDQGPQQHQQVFDWARRIDQLIADGGLRLRAQRIQPLDEDPQTLPKFEILLELPAEDGKPVSPQAFVQAAERLRRSVAVDRWVVHTALEWMRSHPERLSGLGELTINLSGHSMSDDEFLHFLENEFRSGGFPAHKVCFELTETVAVASIHYTADFIRTLRQYGCRFALDDFGTGFSSYAYLQSLPVDYLKIDGIFVRDIDTNMTNYAMVKSITELGQYLGMSVIAECVENQSVADTIAELGVQWMQGWHIERPRPLDSL